MVSGLIVLIVLVCVAVPAFAQSGSRPVAPGAQMMLEHLRRQAREALAARRAEYEKVKTAEQIVAWQRQRRKSLLEALGEMPERTPLRAKVTGRIDGDGYHIEKVIFESRPGLFVTALLYLPAGKPPYPACLVPCGHSKNGKAYDSYQRAPILLARNGIAAFCFDPIGQGERSQLLDEKGEPMQGSTLEHTLVGVGSILLGRNVAADLVWDGIRAIDYLQGREDVDGSRIGCTGTSGGGTQTSYLMALDERVRCAVPCCYVTSFERLFETIGPQDAEQNLFGQVACGLNHADYAILMAPRPLLLGCATQDFFDIEGSWDSFRQAKRIYTRLGCGERVELVEADLPHNFATELRVPMVRWMRRWLCGDYQPAGEAEATVRTEEELRCTPKGQVMWLAGAKSVFELNAELENDLSKGRREFWGKASKAEALAAARRVLGVRALAELPAVTVEKEAAQAREGCTVSRVVVGVEAGVALPGELYEPVKGNGQTCLYLSGGRESDPAGIDRMVRRGVQVLVVELHGIGQTRGREESSQWSEYFGGNVKEFFLAYMLGRSYLGMRVEAALACVRWLGGESERAVHLVGVGEAGPAALHAAALEPELVASLRLERSLRSWAEAVGTSAGRNQLVNAVHGALKVYDLPDLVATLGPGKVEIVGAVGPDRPG